MSHPHLLIFDGDRGITARYLICSGEQGWWNYIKDMKVLPVTIGQQGRVIGKVYLNFKII